MELRQLRIEEVKETYIKHMVKDFPSEELKPLNAIENLIKRKIYKCFGLYGNNQLLAYTFLATSEKSYLLIDYFAVCAEYRNKGIGSKLFGLLKEHCIDHGGILVEVESVEFASDETEKIIRQRRIEFYRKNGMKMTNVLSTLFSVEYSIMCLSDIKLEDSIICKELCNIYKTIILDNLYEEHVQVSYT